MAIPSGKLHGNGEGVLHDEPLEGEVVDEAGQVSLADAAARSSRVSRQPGDHPSEKAAPSRRRFSSVAKWASGTDGSGLELVAELSGEPGELVAVGPQGVGDLGRLEADAVEPAKAGRDHAELQAVIP